MASCWLLVLLIGCNRGPARYHVAGSVTLGGQAVPAGQIFFDPDLTKGNDGRQGYAFIKEGKFDTRLDGEATIGGPHLVRIHAFDGKPGAELPLGRMMVPEFSTPVDLPQEDSTMDFAIPAGGNR
jgi:hypothetical protein